MKKTIKVTKKLNKVMVIYLICHALIGCDVVSQERSYAAMLSVSSDGRYIISTHYGRILILWDVEEKKRKILNKKTNIFSPYFIANSHCFLWQDAETNDVHVQSLEGRIMKSFNPGFPVYGHVMTPNLKHYIASADDWSLYRLDGEKVIRFKKNVHGYSGSARLFQLSLQKNLLLTAGEGYYQGEKFPIGLGHTSDEVNPKIPERVSHSLLDGVVLWDATNGKPIRKFIGMMIKTTATLSPDTNYMAATDENLGCYLWETQTGRRLFSMDLPTDPDLECYGGKQCLAELAEEIKTKKVIPPDFYSNEHANGASVAVKFIDEQGGFIRFVEYANYGVLYNVASSEVVAYLNFGKDPKPYTFSVFDSADVIDTAPKAKILVMRQAGQRTESSNGTGIIVYRFDDKTKQLTRIWAPDGPPPHKRIINEENKWES